MTTYEVRMGKQGGGAGEFFIIVHALTPDMARYTATSQYPGMKALGVRAIRVH